MTCLTKKQLQKPQDQLQARFDALIDAVKGSPLTGFSLTQFTEPENMRFVDSAAVRLAVDDFATILKEVKATLGKR